MSNFILLATVCFLQLVVHSPGHIVLTYPPARKFALDFLDNANTRGPCGMPKGLGPVTSLLTNSALNITWHLAYPHQGGFFIELLNSHNHLQQKLTAGEYTAAEDATTLYWSVNLPQNVTCKNCIIRIVREAKEWVLRNKGVYLFWSCADVNILPASEFRETCSGNGNFSGSKCQCKRLFSGTKCENKDDCWTDSDCSNHGECIKTNSTYFPKSQCYCNFGWFGTHCERNSKIKSRVVDYSLYKMTKMSKRYTMYHRILKSEREIEVILQVDTKTWVALGWRPLGDIKNCRSFPVNFAQPEPEAEAEAEPEAEAEAESTPEPESESTPEPESESTPEPESESTPEPHAEPKHEPEPEPEAEPGADYFHPMDCTDMVIGSAKGEMSRIGDYYTRDRSTPKEDYFYGGTHSLTAALGYEKNGKTIIIFRKQIESNEKQDHGFENDKMHVIWAHGQDEGKYSHQTTSGLEQKSTSDKHYYKEDELKYHGGSEHRGTRRLNFIGEKVMKSYRISIKVSSITWTADFRNKQSKKYREMADRLEKQLMSVFRSVPDLEKVHINNLRAGSIIVDFTVSVMTGLGNERKVRNAVVTVFLGLLKNRTLGNEALDSSYFYLVGPEGENMFDCKKQPTDDHFNHLLTLEILIGVMAAFVIVSILIGISKGCHDWKTAAKEFDKSKL